MPKKNRTIRKKDILEYHEGKRPGKIEVIPIKPSNSQRDLSIAYSPGVAEPCVKISENKANAYRYTAKGNLVAVISNGTAVLGLGDIGPLASKPVMEGKGVLFKIFADIDVFDLELDTTNTEKFIETVKILSPTFGGINLEDISAPECFEIEHRLREELDIPIMHDDQHGTAIITGAALLNALEVVKKDIKDIKVVFNGAGASAISCAFLYLSLGVLPENLIMCDSKGVIHSGRKGLTNQKMKFIRKTPLRSLGEALKIFRGALDVRASEINEKMKLAAVHAIAELAKEPVPEIVNLAYGSRNLTFGPDYIIPKPFDPRLIYTVAPAVAKAAMESGVAKKSIDNWVSYENDLRNRLGLDDKFIRLVMEKAKTDPKRVVFNEADNYKVLKAAQIVLEEGIAIPILLGNENKIKSLNDEYSLGLEEVTIIDTKSSELPRISEYIDSYYKSRQRKGVGYDEARRLLLNRDYFGPMMVKMGDADAYLTGSMVKYPRAVKPVMEILGPKDDNRTVAGVYVMLTKKGPRFFTDTTMNQNPDAEKIAQIACETAELVRKMNIDPRIALLSYSNFGSSSGKTSVKMRDAMNLIRMSDPSLIVDGEMQANFAVDNNLLKEQFPFSDLVGKDPNVFVFPGLSSANISYKLLQSMGSMEAVGPLLVGLTYPAHILQLGCSVREIVNTAAMAVIDAQSRETSDL